MHPLSPLDGRYASAVAPLADIFSEYGLMRFRTEIEKKWLQFLADKGICPPLPEGFLSRDFTEEDFQRIKELERTTNHDVKAVEYFLRERLPKSYWHWIHFACTSEDINNTAYGLMLQAGRASVRILLSEVLKSIIDQAAAWKAIPMLARTHGQPATPVTLGKTWALFAYRIHQGKNVLSQVNITAKFSGATGTFAAHSIAFPDKDWFALSKEFIETYLGLSMIPISDQIEPHDYEAEVLQALAHLSTIFIDFARDVWGYIALGYFRQKLKEGEVGSSTMPHKVNPIDFENAEGNFKISRGLATTLSQELPISRWQRDLTDSTLQRNLGVVFGHFYLGLKSLQRGLEKLAVNEEVIKKDLASHPEVLTEAIQTVLRAEGDAQAYEKLKALSRGKSLSLEDIYAFIEKLDIPSQRKAQLKSLTPDRYIGLSVEITEKVLSLLTS